MGLPEASLSASRPWAGLPASLTGMGLPEGAWSASRPEASAAEPPAPSLVPVEPVPGPTGSMSRE
eukprot:3561312-Rhodomonas_salina.1